MAKKLSDQAKEILADPVRRARVDEHKAAMRAGLRLAEIRAQLGKTQAELARELGISQTRVSRIERAEDINLSTLLRYVDALGGKLQVEMKFPKTKAFQMTPKPRKTTRRPAARRRRQAQSRATA